MHKIKILFGLLFWMPVLLNGQEDTIVQLPAINISKSSIRSSPVGSNKMTWEATKLQQSSATNLADLLTRESNLYIKSYGGNSLATSAVRGASAAQTLMLWNGLPLQSPMLGLLDLSLIPVISADQVEIQKGGSSALWGSGAIGGTIMLENKIQYNKGWSASMDSRLGSFGYWQEQAVFQWGKTNFQSRTKFSHQQADNDFSYRIAPNLPERTQQNAQFSQQHFLQELYWKIRPNQSLSAHFWYAQSNRQIPPTTTQNSSQARQKDWSTRLLLRWQLNQNKWIYRLKAARFSERIRFEDSVILLDAPSQFTTWMAEGEAQRSLGNGQQLVFGLLQFHTLAEADGYIATVRENRSDGFFSYRLQRKQYEIQASLHQSIINNNFSPIVPRLGLDYRPAPRWHLHFQISRNYRWPSLNDRYWVPGGNPDLQAEQGWSQEFGANWHWDKTAHQIRLQATIFNRQIKDWILWTPLEGQGFWSANNIAKVWSRGLETRFDYDYRTKDWHLGLGLGYDYIRSTNEIALRLPRIEAGTQLLYTPTHQGYLRFHFEWKQTSFEFRQQFIGTAHGINDHIPAFSTGRLQFNQRWSWKDQQVTFFAAVQNLWDAAYQVVERRPMPGRHIQIGLRLNFKAKQL